MIYQNFKRIEEGAIFSPIVVRSLYIVGILMTHRLIFCNIPTAFLDCYGRFSRGNPHMMYVLDYYKVIFNYAQMSKKYLNIYL